MRRSGARGRCGREGAEPTSGAVAKGGRRAEGAGEGTGIRSSESRWRRKKGTGWMRQRAVGRTPWRTWQWGRKAVWAVLGASGGSGSGCVRRLERLHALTLFRAGAAGCSRDGRGRASARDGVSGLLLREAMLFGMDERAAREVLWYGCGREPSECSRATGADPYERRGSQRAGFDVNDKACCSRGSTRIHSASPGRRSDRRRGVRRSCVRWGVVQGGSEGEVRQ